MSGHCASNRWSPARVARVGSCFRSSSRKRCANASNATSADGAGAGLASPPAGAGGATGGGGWPPDEQAAAAAATRATKDRERGVDDLMAADHSARSRSAIDVRSAWQVTGFATDEVARCGDRRRGAGGDVDDRHQELLRRAERRVAGERDVGVMTGYGVFAGACA